MTKAGVIGHDAEHVHACCLGLEIDGHRSLVGVLTEKGRALAEGVERGVRGVAAVVVSVVDGVVGEVVGGVVGFLLWATSDLMLYAFTNLLDTTALVLDPVLAIVHAGITGAIIALVAYRVKPSG